MARLNGILRYPSTACGTSDKTLLQLVTGANQPIAVKEVSLSFAGVSNTATPIQVQLLFQTTAGTMTASNPVVEDVAAGETLTTTGQRDASAEPTASNIIRVWHVHPQGGFIWQAVPQDEIIIRPGGTARRIGLKVIAPGASVAVVGYIRFEE